MARPTKPKEIKPKAEGAPQEGKEAPSGGGINGVKLIIVNSITTVLICVLFLAGNYFIVQNTIKTSASQMSAASADGGDSGDGSDSGDSSDGGGDTENQVGSGIILDLGDFILNLSDPNSKRYLKIDVALELSRLQNELPPGAQGGGGGEGESADPDAAIKKELDKYVPAIKDAIISVLSSKTAEELQSVAGKEKAKDEIKQNVDALFNGEREVLRVSFGNFIIQ